MPLKDWFRRVFSSESRDDEAAEREEYGAPGEDEAEPPRSLAGSQPGLYGEDARDGQGRAEGVRAAARSGSLITRT